MEMQETCELNSSFHLKWDKIKANPALMQIPIRKSAVTPAFHFPVLFKPHLGSSTVGECFVWWHFLFSCAGLAPKGGILGLEHL